MDQVQNNMTGTNLICNWILQINCLPSSSSCYFLSTRSHAIHDQSAWYNQELFLKGLEVQEEMEWISGCWETELTCASLTTAKGVKTCCGSFFDFQKMLLALSSREIVVGYVYILPHFIFFIRAI
jgi:hypothetical protein